MKADPGRDFAKNWFSEFVSWANGRGEELAELMSDTAREELLNSYVAWHMRKHAQKEKTPLFWARCEWAGIDVTFGVAKEPFADWEQAWRTELEGEQGVIECKLIYQHQNDAADKIGCAVKQLEHRRACYKHRLGLSLALLYWVSYEGQEPKLDRILERFKLADLGGGLRSIGKRDLRQVWPLRPAGTGNSFEVRLSIGLFELRARGAPGPQLPCPRPCQSRKVDWDSTKDIRVRSRRGCHEMGGNRVEIKNGQLAERNRSSYGARSPIPK